ncbi:MAG: DUF362 domain-containing protein, partial [Calditrichia bacterium]|nr:DUF362 domain-containing protein [Calditrichia bacterium]
TTGAIAGALYFSSPIKGFSQKDKKTRVVLIRDKSVLDQNNKPRQEVLQQMLDGAVITLLNEKDPIKAWKKLINPSDIVGIKTNVWRNLATPKGLEESIKKRIMDCGVSAKNIGINDRGILSDPNFQKATALINTRPMRTHDWSGVGSLIKNYIMFVNKPYEYHNDSCADLASIWKLPIVEGKTRLNILVMLTPLFHSKGPHSFNPKYTWAYKGLLVGFDPVAVDSTGVRIFQAKRKEYFGEDRPISPPPKHIFLADTRHHLGTTDPAKIELIKLGWQDGVLI